MRTAALTRSHRLAYVTAALVVVADQITKRWAISALPSNPIEVIPGLLDFRVTENPGAAFGLFQSGGQVLGVAAVAAVGIISFALRSVHDRPEAVALGLIMGGAIGNLLDRVFRGAGILDGRVVDWIDFTRFPTFNVADSAITIGAALLVALSLKSR